MQRRSFLAALLGAAVAPALPTIRAGVIAGDWTTKTTAANIIGQGALATRNVAPSPFVYVASLASMSAPIDVSAFDFARAA